MIVRGGILEIIPSLAAVGGAFILAMIAVLLALAAFVVIWREGLQGFGMALTALLVGVAILGYPAYLGIKGYRLPAIADNARRNGYERRDRYDRRDPQPRTRRPQGIASASTMDRQAACRHQMVGVPSVHGKASASDRAPA